MIEVKYILKNYEKPENNEKSEDKTVVVNRQWDDVETAAHNKIHDDG